MSAAQVFLTLACVLCIAVGQILFKLIGLSINSAGTILSTKPILLTFVAFSLYGMATLGWIFVLRSVPLVRAYPYMALSFCLVPLFSLIFLGERLSPTYLAGIVLIVSGVLLVGRPG